jgi:biotin carboxyl carrier protein
MKARLALILACLLLLTVGGFAWLRRDIWQGWLNLQGESKEPEAKHQHQTRLVLLSPQARDNLRLGLKQLQLESYWRTLPLPGMVAERPGRSDRGVTASVAGIIRRINAVPGDTVRPGDELFTLQLVSEYLQNSQTELYKTAQELQITQDQKKRLDKAAGLVAEARLLEFEYQLQRLAATSRALRQDLAARGLTPEQIDNAAEGKFVREIALRVPVPTKDKRETEEPPLYEVEELKVQLGDQVQAGQALCTLANHQTLYIEGRVFKHEVPLVERALQDAWPVRAEIAEAEPMRWLPLDARRILFLGNRVDAASQTVPVYLPLVNEHREYETEGRVIRVWRFRPGQRVRLEVPVEKFKGVFVLPIGAVARDGAERYAFRQTGDYFERRPVHVIHEDRRSVVIANDGGVFDGNTVATHGAAQLNRALKAQANSADERDHEHDHHHHHHHHEH